MVEVYLKLFAISLVTVVVTIALYLLKKKTAFSRLPYMAKQVIIGVIFGGVAILGTELGVDIGGAVANVRDAAPLSAGLIFGGPAGIIAGVIGGVERWFAVYWGAGVYARAACAISTVLAGFYAAALRKFLFDNKRPSVSFGFITGVIMEVIHLTILFLSHITDSAKAVEIVSICVVPMTLFNGLAVMLSTLAINIIAGTIKKKKLKYKKISQQVQRWLLVIVVIGFIATTFFVYIFQTETSKNDANRTLTTHIRDVIKDVEERSDISEIKEITRNRHVEQNGFIVIIDASGKIVSDISSHNDEYIGKNLSEMGLDVFSKYNEYTCFEVVTIDKLSFAMYSRCGDYTIIASIPETEVFYTRKAMVLISTFMETLIFGMLFFTIYSLIKQLVVKKINSVNNSLAKIIDGDLNVSVDVHSSDEFASLSNDINSTVATLKHYIDEAAKRIDSELAFAKSIQHSVLPSVFPPYPNITDFDIYAEMHTAKEVGGDFYDFYMCGESKVAFCVADVSGKGIPAAMFMMTTKTMLKNLTESGLNIEEVFNKSNEKLCEGNDTNMFVTVWLGILDYKTGVLEYVNASHNPPFLFRKGAGFEKLKDRTGFVLAGMEGMTYKKQSITLNPGDRIFLYTDGVVEAGDKDKNLYGEERLLKRLREFENDSIKDVITKINGDVNEYKGEAEQFDDITMLLIEYNGNANKNYRVKTFMADDDSVANVTRFVDEVLAKCPYKKSTVGKINLAVEEIVVNVSKYAYGTGGGEIEVKVQLNDTFAEITFTDSGKLFDPLGKADPDITLSAEDRQIGGLGVFIVKKVMDNVSYSNVNGKNVLKIIKNYDTDKQEN